ncbi:MAG: hypothetical protein J6B94_11830 [Lachnospiraceae bacterium]|nr:hypothetical protein [Lachnospiraceae bacterium]
MKKPEKLAKILLIVFIMVFSIVVLARKIPETKYVQNTIERLEKSQNTIMTFSGTSIATSLAISALPDDFASPLASTVSDLNTYFIFMFAVIFVEKLIVIEGIKIAFAWIIPIACLLYIAFMLSSKDVFKNFATKLLILGISVIVVIPFSTYFTETVCKDYLTYVDETIAEADAGAAKINEVMGAGSEDATIFDKLSDAFKTAIQSMSDLLTYFKNVIKKCVNSVAIMLVTTFAVPLVILMLFRWLLKELFALHIPTTSIKIQLPHRKEKKSEEKQELLSKED